MRQPLFVPARLGAVARAGAVNVKLLLLLVVVSIGSVVGLAYLFLSWVSTPLNLTADSIDPAEVGELRVQLLNLPDKRDDIGPVVVKPEDVDKLLAPLRKAEELADKPGMPFLGEYQIRFADGRRLTIRLRFEPKPPRDTRPVLAAAVGCGLAGRGEWVPPTEESVVWMVIEGRIYRAGKLAELIRIADECAARAKG